MNKETTLEKLESYLQEIEKNNRKGKKINLKIRKRKAYKSDAINNISNLRIVSMIPGDRKVAGCFNSSCLFRRGL